MSFVTLNTPEGQPWRVPIGSVNEFLAQGYRRPDPNAVSIAPPSIAPVDLDRVNVNTDSATKIAKALVGIGTATVRTLIANRPYAAIEDLIAKVPLPNDRNWTSYAAQLEFASDAAE